MKHYAAILRVISNPLPDETGKQLPKTTKFMAHCLTCGWTAIVYRNTRREADLDADSHLEAYKK